MSLDKAVMRAAEKDSASVRTESTKPQQSAIDATWLPKAIEERVKSLPPGSGDPADKNFVDFRVAEKAAAQNMIDNKGNWNDTVKKGFLEVIADADNLDPKKVDQYLDAMGKDLLPKKLQSLNLDAQAKFELEKLANQYSVDPKQDAILKVAEKLKGWNAIEQAQDVPAAKKAEAENDIIKSIEEIGPQTKDYATALKATTEFKAQHREELGPTYEKYTDALRLKFGSAESRVMYAANMMSRDIMLLPKHPQALLGKALSSADQDFVKQGNADREQATALEKQALALTPDAYKPRVTEMITEAEKELQQLTQKIMAPQGDAGQKGR